MNDFLTRVAEKALGTAPRIDPQSASRFSPSRLPLPELPLPDITGAAPDSALLRPHDSYVDQTARRQSSPRPAVTPVTEETVANAPGYVAALKIDRSPEEPATETGPGESLSKSITDSTPRAKSVVKKNPGDAQTRSIADRDRDAAPLDRGAIPERPDIGTSAVISALEVSMIGDDARHRVSESFRDPAASNGYVSAPNKSASLRGADEPQTADLAPAPSMDDRDVESKSSIAVDSFRSSTTTPPSVVLPNDHQPARAFDHHRETRGAVSAEFVRPATARADRSDYERKEESEPSIRVTIGRVEVRAAPPAPVVQPVAPPAPKLSLAEFLRQHNERRR